MFFIISLLSAVMLISMSIFMSTIHAATTITGTGTLYNIQNPEQGRCMLQGLTPMAKLNYASISESELQRQKGCGTCVELQCTEKTLCKNPSTKIQAYVTNIATDQKSNSIQLSSNVLKQLVSTSDTNVISNTKYPMTYQFVQCSENYVSNNLQVCFMDGSSASWIALQPNNVRKSIETMTINGIEAKFQPDGYSFAATMTNNNNNNQANWYNSIKLEMTSFDGEKKITTVSFPNTQKGTCATADVQFSSVANTNKGNDSKSKGGATTIGVIVAVVGASILIVGGVFVYRKRLIHFDPSSSSSGSFHRENSDPEIDTRSTTMKKTSAGNILDNNKKKKNEEDVLPQQPPTSTAEQYKKMETPMRATATASVARSNSNDNINASDESTGRNHSRWNDLKTRLSGVFQRPSTTEASSYDNPVLNYNYDTTNINTMTSPMMTSPGNPVYAANRPTTQISFSNVNHNRSSFNYMNSYNNTNPILMTDDGAPSLSSAVVQGLSSPSSIYNQAPIKLSAEDEHKRDTPTSVIPTVTVDSLAPAIMPAPELRPPSERHSGSLINPMQGDMNDASSYKQRDSIIDNAAQPHSAYRGTTINILGYPYSKQSRMTRSSSQQRDSVFSNTSATSIDL